MIHRKFRVHLHILPINNISLGIHYDWKYWHFIFYFLNCWLFIGFGYNHNNSSMLWHDKLFSIDRLYIHEDGCELKTIWEWPNKNEKKEIRIAKSRT